MVAKGFVLLAGLGLSVFGASASRADLPEPAPGGRYVHAQVAALEQPIFYNRFESFNPYGAIYALLNDVVDANDKRLLAWQAQRPISITAPEDAAASPQADPNDPGALKRSLLASVPITMRAAALGAGGKEADDILWTTSKDKQPSDPSRPTWTILRETTLLWPEAGKVRLRDGKRPRPLVLRGNVGDILIVDFVNLLPDDQPDLHRCRPASPYRGDLQDGDEPNCRWLPPYAGLTQPSGEQAFVNGDWPLTRTASIAAPGLEAVRCDGTSGAPDDLATGMRPIAPGATARYCFRLGREGTFLFSSLGAPAGGEGDGGSLSHGLFGAVNVLPQGSIWYRSQVTQGDLQRARDAAGRGDALLDYQARYDTGDRAAEPVLAMAAPGRIPKDDWVARPRTKDGRLVEAADGQAPEKASLWPTAQEDDWQDVLTLVHGDLTAIVDRCPKFTAGIDDHSCAFRAAPAIRDFTIIFHDELKTFYPDALKELEGEESAFPALPGTGGEAGLGGGFNPLAGVRDGFAINYGSSGMGAVLLANRKGRGPAADCVECAYEEFFLQSWANGDPALLARYQDDPSNVYHSYLGDPVVFRNSHAGPKETHVFHLHAHQWLAQTNPPGVPAPDGIPHEYGTYLDSQTIAPMQGFAYEIYHGGSGNLNLTVGDSIFHCHLYPHFAQGMWSLWRVHDVFEDGSRRLPDLEEVKIDGTPGKPGWGNLRPDGSYREVADGGTPIPALVPLPGRAMVPKPSKEHPGYPFFIAGQPGHRAPQAPKDIAVDGGLPRHVISGGTRTVSEISDSDQQTANDPDAVVRHALVTGDFTTRLETARIKLLNPDGEQAEQSAMAFHSGTVSGLKDPAGEAMAPWTPPSTATHDPVAAFKARTPGYTSRTPDGRTLEADGKTPVVFHVNGGTGKAGAPYADPCRDIADKGNERKGWEDEPRLTRYDVSAISVPLTVNKSGWHDPQGIVNVLSQDVTRYEGRTPARGDVKPFFFRVHSGDCIEFRHTNRVNSILSRDDFQLRTPTDTIGQHIHLVKFDVTASDGSGNGWNYEDGTFAKEALQERLEAAHAWQEQYGNDTEKALDARTLETLAQACGAAAGQGEGHCKADYQTTIQRWYADPLLTWVDDGNGRELKSDRTLRTVFTHDHFGPSSIQQHGFYSALLIEPKGSMWYEVQLKKRSAPRSNTADLPARLKDHDLQPMLPGQAVGSQAIIDNIGRDDQPLHGATFREFALAVADFALLYHGRDNTPVVACKEVKDAADGSAQGLDGLCRDLNLAAADLQAFPFLQGARLDRLRQDVDAWRTKHGRPVDPPRRPEAISKDHHNPYLLNYANEPLPLRLVDKAGKPNKNEAGDLAFVFSSEVDGRGDPATELLQAYENERIQLRLIQGAQEVQHVAQVQGLRWRREAGDPSSPFVGAQEIGISEHFEIGVDRLPVVQTSTAPEGERDDLPFTDHLYSAGTLDALWNGAWGLLRVHDTPAETDQGVPVAMVDEVRAVNLKLAGEAAIAVHKSKVSQAEQQSANEGQYLGAVVATELKSNSLLPSPPKQADIVVDAITSLGAQLSDLAGEAAIKAGDSLFFAIKSKEAIAENRRKKEPKPQENLEPLLLKAEDGGYLACPKSGPTVSFLVEAWSTSDWLRRPVPGAEYAQQGRLADAAGLTFRLLHVERKPLPLAASDEVQRRWRESARTIDHSRGYVPPLVLRANAGECIQVVLRNCLLGEGADKSCRKDGTVAEDQESDRNRAVGDDHHEQGMLPRITPLNSQHLTPSKYLDLQPQLVSWDLARTNGIPVGKNAVKPVAPGSSAALTWYAGVINSEECHQRESHKRSDGSYFWPCNFPVDDRHYYEFKPTPFGAVPLLSMADVVEHASQGLIGTLVVEPVGSRHLEARSGRRLDATDSDTGLVLAARDNGASEAVIQWREPTGVWAMPRHEYVLTYEDGLGLRFDPPYAPREPVPDCRVCDDSYDLGETAVSARSEPFWMRLGLESPIDEDRKEAWNLNRIEFPTTFFPGALDGSRPAATPTLRATAGELLSFRVTHPGGRARQRTFLIYGHDYPDLLPRHGSAASALLAPGKAINAHVCDLWGEPRRSDYGYETRLCAVGGAHPGRWLWRDGPAQFFSGGAWGALIVE